MDPLSVIAGITGIAAVCTQLATTIYTISDRVRYAPVIMQDLAANMSLLSGTLENLAEVLQRGKAVYRPRVIEETQAIMARIKAVQNEIRKLIQRQRGFRARMGWLLNYGKVYELVERLEALKSAMNLVLWTVQLAITQKELPSHNSPIKARMIRLVDSVMRANKQALINLQTNLRPPVPRDWYSERLEPPNERTNDGTSFENNEPQPAQREPDADGGISLGRVQEENEQELYSKDRLEKERAENAHESLMRTASWLFKMVFAPELGHDASGIRIDIDSGDDAESVVMEISTLLPPAHIQELSTSEALPRLLSSWTLLEAPEINSLLVSTGESVASDDTLVECGVEHGFIYEEDSDSDPHPTEWKGKRRHLRSDSIHLFAQPPAQVYVVNETGPQAQSSTFNYMNDAVRNHNASSKHRYPAPSEQRIHLEDEIADLKEELLLAQSSRIIDDILERMERLTKKKDHLDLLEEPRSQASVASENIRREHQYDLRHEREEITRAGFDKSHKHDVNLDTGLASAQEEYLNEIATLRAEKEQLRKAMLYQTNLEEQNTLARKMRLDEEEIVKGTQERKKLLADFGKVQDKVRDIEFATRDLAIELHGAAEPSKAYHGPKGDVLLHLGERSIVNRHLQRLQDLFVDIQRLETPINDIENDVNLTTADQSSGHSSYKTRRISPKIFSQSWDRSTDSRTGFVEMENTDTRDVEAEPTQYHLLFPYSAKSCQLEVLQGSLEERGIQIYTEIKPTPTMNVQDIEVEKQLRKTYVPSSLTWEPSPWHGQSELFDAICKSGWKPLYMRGSDRGQTWFHGPEPIFVRFLSPKYVPQLDGVEHDLSHSYLLIGTDLVEEDAFRLIGIDYQLLSTGYWMLDSTIAYNDLLTLIGTSFILRETGIRRSVRKALHAPSATIARPKDGNILPATHVPLKEIFASVLVSG